jgi:hypothetical protein
VLLDLGELTPGTHQITPTVVLLPDQLTAVTVQPSQVEVILERGQPPTRTLTPSVTPTPTRTFLPTWTPSPPPPTAAPPTATPTAPPSETPAP